MASTRESAKRILRGLFGLMFSSRPCIRQIRTNGGQLLLWEHEHVGRKITLRMFERRETKWLKTCLRRGDICIDVGANIGYYTQLLAGLVGAEGKVVAVEPFWTNCSLIRLTAMLNSHSGWVRVIQCAAGERSGSGLVCSGGDSAYAHIGETSESTEEVNVVPLDEIVKQEDLVRVDFLKMDIEGAELLALRGSEVLLGDEKRRPRLMMIELYSDHLARFGTSIDEVIAFLRTYSYRPYEISRDLKLVPLARERWNRVYNVIFAPDPYKSE